MSAPNAIKGIKGFAALPVAERFWSKVDKNGPNGCWVWKGVTDTAYGSFWFERRHRKAHHVAWLLLRGPLPEGLLACHHCDNPPCVNPDHIFWGTMTENIMDSVHKGRFMRNRKARRRTK